MEIYTVVIAALLGGAAGFLASARYFSARLDAWRVQAESTNLQAEGLKAALMKAETSLSAKEQAMHTLIADHAASKATVANLQEKLVFQKQEVDVLHQQLHLEFRNLANAILEEKTLKFTEHNKSNLHDLLFPLGEKIKEFEKKVEATYDRELREQVSLKTEIRGLHELNKQLSEEAGNLVKALKGDTKMQGNWGELILEKILEQSGLVKEREYLLQYSSVSADGNHIQPDAVILLPGNRHFIIDSKVSLKAYEAAVNAQTEDERTMRMKEHVLSVKNHIRLLSSKKYQTAAGLHAPDFVFLFLWSEAAFSAALQADSELFHYAWQRNIAMVSPTTIWANLKTIAGTWRSEQQNRHAEEIARHGADLYDKLVGFVNDLLLTSKKIDELKKSHDEAISKLHTGNGNLIRRAEKMRELGLKPMKRLPEFPTGNVLNWQ